MRKAISKAIELLPGFSRVGDAYWGVLVFSSWYFLGIAPLDPDLHHDGVQYAAAAGVADGLHIQSQIFQQYGPITAWVQGLTLKMFGMNLLILRIETAVFFTITALLLLKILLLLRIPHFVSVLVCAAWVIACPVTATTPRISYGYALWPWPTAITTLLLLANSWIILRAFKSGRHLQKWEIYILSAFCVVMIFTRFQVGVIASFFSLAPVIFSWLPSLKTERVTRIRRFFASFGLVSIVCLSVLGLQGSLASFVGQVITGSLDRYVNPFAWRFYADYYLYGSTPFIVLVALSIITWKTFKGLVRKVIQITISALFLAGLYLGNVSMPIFTWSTKPIRFMFDQSQMSFVYGATTIVGLVSLYVVLFSFCRGIQKCFRGWTQVSITEPITKIESVVGFNKVDHSTGSQDRKKKLYLLLTICLVPFVVQLYPMADQIHLWWISPFILIFFTVILRDLVSQRGATLILTSLLLPLLAISTYSFLDFRAIPRSLVFNQANAFAGMKVQDRYLPSYDKIGGILGEVAPQSAKFDCQDGLISAWTGRYLASDAKYVSWAWKADSEPGAAMPTRFFICASPTEARVFADGRGFTLMEPGINYEFGLFSSGTFFEYRTNANLSP